jgi:hypothetical protein
MAKKAELANPFAKTTTSDISPTTVSGAIDYSDLDNGRLTPLSAGMREGEIAALQMIANEMGASRNAVIRGALRSFIKMYREKQITKADLFATKTVTKFSVK